MSTSSYGVTAGSGLVLEPTQNAGNSLTTFIRSIEDLTGQQGQGLLASGGNLLQGGLNTSAPALSLLTQLTKGDQGDVTQAAQPEIDQISQQFDAIRNMISMQPRGGGKTTALAEAPFQKSSAIQKTEGAMRTSAAGQLGQLGTTLAGLGLGQEQVGAGLEGQSANIALTKEGQDYSQPTSLEQLNEGLKDSQMVISQAGQIASMF
jgi:hypothetical protein